MFDGRFRATAEKGLAPIGANLQRTGLKADHLTAFGVVMAVGAAIAIGGGALRLGLVLLVLTAVPDVLDGAVAKASGTASPRGAFFDSPMPCCWVGWHGSLPRDTLVTSCCCRWRCWDCRC
jgi:CDP-diacylglycerol--glycerol-3-phosphate 3-phosphatidyltransferase